MVNPSSFGQQRRRNSYSSNNSAYRGSFKPTNTVSNPNQNGNHYSSFAAPHMGQPANGLQHPHAAANHYNRSPNNYKHGQGQRQYSASYSHPSTPSNSYQSPHRSKQIQQQQQHQHRNGQSPASAHRTTHQTNGSNTPTNAARQPSPAVVHRPETAAKSPQSLGNDVKQSSPTASPSNKPTLNGTSNGHAVKHLALTSSQQQELQRLLTTSTDLLPERMEFKTAVRSHNNHPPAALSGVEQANSSDQNGRQTATHIFLNAAANQQSTSQPSTPGKRKQPATPTDDQRFTEPAYELFPRADLLPYMRWNTDAKRGPGLGLHNLGNTCFMNACIQALLHIPPMVQYLLSRHHSKSCQYSHSASAPTSQHSSPYGGSGNKFNNSTISPFYKRPNSPHNNNSPQSQQSQQRTTCFFCLLENLAVMSHSKANGSYSPHEFARSMCLLSRRFKIGRQEDSHELLRCLLDAMEKSALHPYKQITDQRIKETTIVSAIFGGYFRSSVRCMSCHHQSNTYDQFLDLSLDINSQISTVSQALTAFKRPDMLDGGSAQYKCGHCHKKVRAQKQMTIEREPNVLCIHLKRFAVGGSSMHSGGGGYLSSFSMGGGKNNKPVSFNKTLSLTLASSRFADTYHDMKLEAARANREPPKTLNDIMSAGAQQQYQYDLCGVLVHSGYSAHSGHYFSFVKASNDLWYEMNDSSVRQVGEQTVLQQNAYMLFYIKHHPDAPGAEVAEPAAAAEQEPSQESIFTPPTTPLKREAPTAAVQANGEPTESASAVVHQVAVKRKAQPPVAQSKLDASFNNIMSQMKQAGDLGEVQPRPAVVQPAIDASVKAGRKGTAVEQPSDAPSGGAQQLKSNGLQSSTSDVALAATVNDSSTADVAKPSHNLQSNRPTAAANKTGTTAAEPVSATSDSVAERAASVPTPTFSVTHIISPRYQHARNNVTGDYEFAAPASAPSASMQLLSPVNPHSVAYTLKRLNSAKFSDPKLKQRRHISVNGVVVSESDSGSASDSSTSSQRKRKHGKHPLATVLNGTASSMEGDTTTAPAKSDALAALMDYNSSASPSPANSVRSASPSSDAEAAAAVAPAQPTAPSVHPNVTSTEKAHDNNAGKPTAHASTTNGSAPSALTATPSAPASVPFHPRASHNQYGMAVTGWDDDDGKPGPGQQSVKRQQTAILRSEGHPATVNEFGSSYNAEYDKGRAKKVKVKHHQQGAKANGHGHNDFQQMLEQRRAEKQAVQTH